MGDIADDMIDGACCQVCGVYFEHGEAGYPVACTGCGGDYKDGDELDKPRQEDA